MAGLGPPAFFDLFSTGQYSDFTVACKEREFKVHKMVICLETHSSKLCARVVFRYLPSTEQPDD
jgi:hypothetical protein